MPRSRLSRKLILLVPLVALVLLGGYWWKGRRAPAVGLTPDTPKVKRLREAAKGLNVVVVVLDAARADHFGCYGYPREITPNCDGLAREGVVFRNHFVHAVETKPSTTSLFTSQYPDTHLAYEDRFPPKDASTLAQGFRDAGYQTVLFSQNAYASPVWGLGLEFQEAFYNPHLLAAGRDVPNIWKPEALLEQIGPWLERGPREPFFAYVHFMPPHSPYIMPLEMYYQFYQKAPPQARKSDYPFAEVELEARRRQKPWDQHLYLNRYDSHLLYGDWAVGQLVAMLRAAGVMDRTLFIVTADHGEAFGEHGYLGHVTSAYDECTHVPFILHFPGAEAPKGEVSGLTQTVDVLPTLFDLLRIPVPSNGIQGRTLLPLMAGEKQEVNDYVFCRTAGVPPSYSVRNHQYLLLLYQGGKLRALYDLKKDPHAVSNLAEKEPKVVAELTEVFGEFARQQLVAPLDFADEGAAPAKLPEVERVKLTEEMKRSLKALGYLD